MIDGPDERRVWGPAEKVPGQGQSPDERRRCRPGTTGSGQGSDEMMQARRAESWKLDYRLIVCVILIESHIPGQARIQAQYLPPLHFSYHSFEHLALTCMLIPQWYPMQRVSTCGMSGISLNVRRDREIPCALAIFEMI